MKISRYFLAVALVIILLMTFASCGDSGGEETSAPVVYYTVQFDSNGGSDVPSVRVVKDGYAAEPSAPVRDGFIFDGWTNNSVDWDFDGDKVKGDMTLTAKWVDAEAIYNFVPVDGGIHITEIKRELTVMRIPAKMNGKTVTGIGDGAFEGALSEGITQIVLPETVTHVGKNAFANCAGIEIVVEGAITSLGEGAFMGCDALTSVALGEGLTTIPFNAFSGCTTLGSVRIPESVTTICENAFEECSALSSVMLHSTTSVIEDAAFRFCDALTAVYYYGTESDFGAVSVASGNDSIKEAGLYLYSETEPVGDGDYWYLDSKGRVRVWK